MNHILIRYSFSTITMIYRGNIGFTLFKSCVVCHHHSYGYLTFLFISPQIGIQKVLHSFKTVNGFNQR